MTARTLDVGGLSELIDHLWAVGYEVWGPQLDNGVIAPGLLRSVADLPLGWTDEQEPGHYRIRSRDDGARFGYAVGPRSYKELLHPPRQQIWTMNRDARGELSVAMTEPQPVRRAFFGVRPCELAAIGKQDRILMEGPHADPVYSANRADVLIVAVDCGDPSATCFCPSMDTGPRAGPGHDLAITELVGADPSGHDSHYVVRVGSPRGEAVLDAVPSRPTPPNELAASEAVTDTAADTMVRALDTEGVKDAVYDSLTSPQWEYIAERCLACGNCTLVCPTCFCTNLVDVTDLAGDETTRWRVADTCFSTEFSHLGPGPIRASTAARYRQWFSHKLAGWIDQFDESGCVGCGRCITWCPVGIDITAELAVIRAGQESVR